MLFLSWKELGVCAGFPIRKSHTGTRFFPESALVSSPNMVKLFCLKCKDWRGYLPALFTTTNNTYVKTRLLQLQPLHIECTPLIN